MVELLIMSKEIVKKSKRLRLFIANRILGKYKGWLYNKRKLERPTLEIRDESCR